MTGFNPQEAWEWRRLAEDQKVIAERKWSTGAKPKEAQKPCDVGLFSDDHKQEELF